MIDSINIKITQEIREGLQEYIEETLCEMYEETTLCEMHEGYDDTESLMNNFNAAVPETKSLINSLLEKIFAGAENEINDDPCDIVELITSGVNVNMMYESEELSTIINKFKNSYAETSRKNNHERNKEITTRAELVRIAKQAGYKLVKI